MIELEDTEEGEGKRKLVDKYARNTTINELWEKLMWCMKTTVKNNEIEIDLIDYEEEDEG